MYGKLHQEGKIDYIYMQGRQEEAWGFICVKPIFTKLKREKFFYPILQNIDK